MKIESLAENVHKNHLQIQSQLSTIHNLKTNIRDSRLECLQSQWLARNRRYLTEKLNQNCKEHIDLIDALNHDETFHFVKASTNTKFSSTGETTIIELFQYLRDNPKLIAYLLFFTESEKSSFLELFAKISVSSIYSHCVYESDRNGVVQILNELVDIYINFYSMNFRSQIYHKNSAFIVMFQSFCTVLPEVKTFFNLTLRQAIMQVLTEDTFYLDIDPNKAFMRFKPDERFKHFGQEGSTQFNERMQTYKGWTIQRLKTFVDMFINHLKCNIFAFPKSLATIFVRLFSKMIVTMEFDEVRTIFLDLLFSFLICPVIQNPDWFGLVDIHIDNVAKYNLQQCALIIQHLALSQTNTEHESVCELFDKDSLAFVIDHILSIFNNHEQAQQSPKLHSRFDRSPENIPCFLISEFELKLVLEYLRLFMERNIDCSEDLKRLYSKIPKQCFQFELSKPELKPPSRSGVVNTLKLPSSLRKQRSQETIVDLNEEFCFDTAFGEKNTANLLEHYKPLMFSRKVLQFYLYDNQEIEIYSSKAFFQQFKSVASQFDTFSSLLDYLQQKFHLEQRRKSTGSIQNFESPDKLLLLDLDSHLNVDLNGPFGTKHVILEDVESIVSRPVDNEKLIDLSPAEESNFQLIDVESESFTKISHYPTPSSTSRPSSSSSSASSRLNAKAFFALNLKNIKDKGKNIFSIKDNVTGQSKANEKGLFDTFVYHSEAAKGSETDPYESRFNPENIQDKTDEILSKYRSNVNKIDPQEKLLDLDEFFPEQGLENLGNLSKNDCRSKLFRLFCLVNFTPVLENFEFLKLEEKNHFIMLLKVLLSEAQNSQTLTEIVLITDIINSLKAMSVSDFHHSITLIQDDLKLNMFYSVYLFKCQEFLLDYRAKFGKMKEHCLAIQQETDYKVVIFLTGKVFDDHERALNDAAVRINDLSVPLDEKIDNVKVLMRKMLQSNELSVLTEQQLYMAKEHIERHLISSFYLQLFFANGDIDRLRDQIMHQQIDKLSSTIVPSSKMLKIPVQFQSSSPWPSAQRELQLMSVYKTALKKVECIERCCKHIITLLNAADSAVPAADDLLPVLIFVVIKANPMSLLSTIQYVNAFLTEDLGGESAYYWTQFCSVVEFIKTVIHQTD